MIGGGPRGAGADDAASTGTKPPTIRTRCKGALLLPTRMYFKILGIGGPLLCCLQVVYANPAPPTSQAQLTPGQFATFDPDAENVGSACPGEL